MEPATLLAGLREHLAQRAPESERPVPGGQHRGAHAAAAAITQQIGPRLGGLAVTVGERYQLLATVGAHPDHHQQAQLLVVQAHVDMDAVSPLALPRNCPSAGTKAPDESPCRYSSGNTSPIFGVLRAHGGKIDDENRCRSPVSGSTRLSLTRGAVTSTAPALVVTVRDSWQPMRTTSR